MELSTTVAKIIGIIVALLLLQVVIRWIGRRIGYTDGQQDIDGLRQEVQDLKRRVSAF